jgi:hypothetical protein
LKNKTGIIAAFLFILITGVAIYIGYAEEYDLPPINLPPEMNEVETLLKNHQAAIGVYAVGIALSLFSLVFSVGRPARKMRTDTSRDEWQYFNEAPKVRKTNPPDKPYPLHPDDMKSIKAYSKPKTSAPLQEKPGRSFTSGRFALTGEPNKKRYYPPLSSEDIAELLRTGAEYYPAPQDWEIPPDLSHLSKEEAWALFTESYRETVLKLPKMNPWEYKFYISFKWLFDEG